MSYQHWQEISFYLDELDKERAAFEKINSAEALDATRKTMAHLLENLRTSLEKSLDKHNASLILFAIIAGVDERMQTYDYNSHKVKWVPLQKDFYAAYTAGEVFYKSIDEILDDPGTPNIVYQVYYTILKRGFRGKYQDSKTQVAKYLEMLKDKIPVSAQSSKIEPASDPLPKKKERLKKWHYYCLSACFSALVLIALFLFSSLP